jgi:hypothetical protein
LDPENLVSKAFALGWFFPLRQDAPRLGEARHFFANNVAFRREVIIAHPFPPMDRGQTRGARSSVAKILTAHGIEIWKTSAARTPHPTPTGGITVTRALADGRDWASKRGLENNPSSSPHHPSS